MIDDQWLSFKVESETYIHCVDKIKEVIPYTPPFPVPGSPSCTEGILNVRGNVITIFSGRSLFDCREPEDAEGKKIIILELGEDLVGVSVDAVIGIITFETDNVEWSNVDTRNNHIKGTLQLSGQLYILTDLSDCSYTSDENM
jgi:purine-binding chemotaxis protein CheW